MLKALFSWIPLTTFPFFPSTKDPRKQIETGCAYKVVRFTDVVML